MGADADSQEGRQTKGGHSSEMQTDDDLRDLLEQESEATRWRNSPALEKCSLLEQAEIG